MVMSQSHFVEFSKPFISAAKNVFETMVFCKLDPQKPSIKQGDILKGEVTAILGLSGIFEQEGKKSQYQALLVLSFPYTTYFKVASAMLGETYHSFVPEINDAGAEIVNMIMGNVKNDLKILGYTSNMAIPSTIEGKDHSVSYPTGAVVILIPIKSTHGDMFMEICYTDNQNNS
jgi:chemotaxis protein CheX